MAGASHRASGAELGVPAAHDDAPERLKRLVRVDGPIARPLGLHGGRSALVLRRDGRRRETAEAD